MGRIEEIQSAIESLPQDEFRRLRDWFTEKDWEEWDKEIEADSKSGKLDFPRQGGVWRIRKKGN